MNVGLVAEARDAYVGGFARALASTRTSPQWLASARREAFDAFVEQGFPSRKHEDWRFTDMSPVTRFLLPPGDEAVASVAHGLIFEESLFQLGRGRGHRMVFVDGRHRTDHAAWQPRPRGLVLEPLFSALGNAASPTGLVLGRQLAGQNAFTALNTAFMTDGALVRIPAGLVVESPILLVFLAAAEGCASFPRTVVEAGADSQATIVELHIGADGRATLSNAVTEIVLESGARLAYHGIQKPSGSGFHIGHLAVTQKTGSNFFAHSLSLGGRLVRNDVHVLLGQESCTCQLDGIYLASGTSHIDNHTTIDHAAPRSTSREDYKGVVSDRGVAVWNGRAVVRPGAQGTDARQTSRNLILADGARIHAKPHLEIFANDVKCSHGATTGRLDPEALFYLRSRGIGEKDANHILISAFLREGLARVADAPLRGELEAILASRTSDLAAEGASA